MWIHEEKERERQRERETLTTRLCRCYTNVNIGFHPQSSKNHIIKYLLLPWIFLCVSVLTQSLLVSVRLNKAGKLCRAIALSGAAYRHLMGQKSQSVLTIARRCTASLVLPQASEMGGSGKLLVCRGKLEQTVSPTLKLSPKWKMRRWPLACAV